MKPTAYGGLLMLVLLSKIEETDTFKATKGQLISKCLYEIVI